jgi:hypothetical protein
MHLTHTRGMCTLSKDTKQEKNVYTKNKKLLYNITEGNDYTSRGDIPFSLNDQI